MKVIIYKPEFKNKWLTELLTGVSYVKHLSNRAGFFVFS